MDLSVFRFPPQNRCGGQPTFMITVCEEEALEKQMGLFHRFVVEPIARTAPQEPYLYFKIDRQEIFFNNTYAFKQHLGACHAFHNSFLVHNPAIWLDIFRIKHEKRRIIISYGKSRIKVLQNCWLGDISRATWQRAMVRNTK